MHAIGTRKMSLGSLLNKIIETRKILVQNKRSTQNSRSTIHKIDYLMRDFESSLRNATGDVLDVVAR